MNISAVICKGLAASEGVVCGRAFVLKAPILEEPPRITIARSDIQKEIARFEDAVALTRGQLRELATGTAMAATSSESDIFEAHRMVIDDQFFYDSVVSRISSMLCNSEYAVFLVLDEFIGMLMRMGDSYIKERSLDFQDIRRRLMLNLSGQTEELLKIANIKEPCILIADELSPSDTVSLPKGIVLGVVTRHGNVTSHSAVLARAVGVPAVVGVQDLPAVSQGTEILLDGYNGRILINPSEEEKAFVFEETAVKRQQMDLRQRLRDKPAITPDGIEIRLMVNTDHGAGFDAIKGCGAQGIGLYRTEYLWLTLGREPTEAEQVEAYSEVVQAANGSEAVIRLLDIGGDKLIGEDSAHHEANPFLGRRSIRYLLSEREVFRRQLRAILQAAVFGQVSLMYPMVTTLDELRECRKEFEAAMEELRAGGVPFSDKVRCGVMIEVPSAAICADQFAYETDFFSIGTNDLTQYTLAVDRGNELIAGLYQPVNPAVLRLIAMTVAAGEQRNIPVCVCGEMAGDPILAMILIGLGVKTLSMSPPLVLQVKEMICSVPHEEMKLFAKSAIEGCASAEEILDSGKELVARYLG